MTGCGSGSDATGRGAGPGWTPGVAGRRALRWLDHADFALGEGLRDPAVARTLARQALFLRRRAGAAPEGPERVAALAGLIRSALALDGLEGWAAPAARALAGAASCVGPGGAIPSRSPEALLDLLALLSGAAGALRDAEMAVPEGLRRPSVAPPRRCAPCATPTGGWRASTAARAARRGGSTAPWPRAAYARGPTPPRRGS